MSLRIRGTGSCLPERVVTNEELEGILDTSDEWIRTRTGIGSRHIATAETTTAMALEASRRALENAGLTGEDLDLIIVGTVSADYTFPSTACLLQAELGATGAFAFDINAACSAFLYGLGIADAFMSKGRVHRALVVGAETLSKIMNWEDRSTCVLFGDGAGAAVVEEDPEAVFFSMQGSDGGRGMALNLSGRPGNNPFLDARPSEAEMLPGYTTMDGQAVYRFAVKTVPVCIREVLEMAGWEPDEVKLYGLHQANLRIIEAVAKRLGQPMEKFPTILQECGNISAGSVPILLDRMNRDGLLDRGDRIVLAGFGAGLTWSGAALKW